MNKTLGSSVIKIGRIGYDLEDFQLAVDADKNKRNLLLVSAFYEARSVVGLKAKLALHHNISTTSVTNVLKRFSRCANRVHDSRFRDLRILNESTPTRELFPFVPERVFVELDSLDVTDHGRFITSEINFDELETTDATVSMQLNHHYNRSGYALFAQSAYDRELLVSYLVGSTPNDKTFLRENGVGVVGTVRNFSVDEIDAFLVSDNCKKDLKLLLRDQQTNSNNEGLYE